MPHRTTHRPRGRLCHGSSPRMLELARDRTNGAHPYLVTPQHTQLARAILGPGKLLAPMQLVLLESDPDRARTIARSRFHFYLGAQNYARSLLFQGFTEEDLANGGSDRLIDAIVAWGDVETVAARIREHHEAGADHVAIQPVPGEFPLAIATLTQLAPAVVEK
jgi:probable F420-dependent oxidoreductase